MADNHRLEAALLRRKGEHAKPPKRVYTTADNPSPKSRFSWQTPAPNSPDATQMAPSEARRLRKWNTGSEDINLPLEKKRKK